VRIAREVTRAEGAFDVIDIRWAGDLTAETRSLQARHNRRLRPSLGCRSLRFSALDGPESHSSCYRFQSGIPGPVRYGSRDFRGCSRKSGRLCARFDVRNSHKNSHLTSIDESRQCRVTSCHYRRPRRLAWPKTPDFQSGTAVVCRSHSVSLGHPPSQRSSHPARPPERARPATECD
jgi:hypothetical protein